MSLIKDKQIGGVVLLSCGVFNLNIISSLGDAPKYQPPERQRKVFLHISGQK